MSKKLTPWFPAEVFPAHHGDYETADPGIFRNWNGRAWSFHWVQEDRPERIERQKEMRWMVGRGVTWRGLAKEPK